MLYSDFLKQASGCPFCQSTQAVIEETQHAYMTYSLAPYHKHHLLVVPRRHEEHFLGLTDAEVKDIDALVKKGARLLQVLGYEDYTMLVRDGSSNQKTIPHLHYHIIPADPIGDLKHDGSMREILTESEIASLLSELAAARATIQ